MYKIISSGSLIIRVLIYNFTIAKIDIFNNVLIAEIFDNWIAFPTVLWFLSYFTNRIIIFKYDIDDSSLRSVLYFFIWTGYWLIYYVILWLLTKTGIIPF